MRPHEFVDGYKGKIELDIVIVNWNSGDFLKYCTQSILNNNSNAIIKIYLIDNNSSDNSLSGIEDGAVQIVRNTHNYGFAKACNQGANLGSGKYILFLNPDTELKKNVLDKALFFLEDMDNERIAGLGIRMLNSLGEFSTSLARFPTAKSVLAEALMLYKIFPNIYRKRFLNESECKESRYAEEINGSFLLIRRSIFDVINGFDTQFFMYCDELDLCKRINNAGYSMYYLHDLTSYHFGGGCSNKIPVKRVFYALNSKIKYIKKHMRFPASIFLIPLVIFIEYPMKLLGVSIQSALRKFKSDK